ncbi:MAG: FtsX-like permease family protein [Gammaproteobacteria bacterium]
MNLVTHALRNVSREWRSGELVILMVSLLLAVGSLSSVSVFTERVREAVNRQAAESLAADLVLQSRNPIDAELEIRAHGQELNTARILSFPSVVTTEINSQLVEVRAVTEGYPLRGRLRIAKQAYGNSAPTDEIPAPGEAWAEARALGGLGIRVGEVINVGASRIRVSRVLVYAPDQGWNIVNIAPTLLLNYQDVAATKLVSPASRVWHRILFAGTVENVAEFADYLEESKQAGEKLMDIRDGRPEMRNAVERAGRFLNLAALVAVLIAGIAIAIAARRYAARETDAVAILKCLGASRRSVVGSYTLQLLVLGLVAGTIGALLGYLAQSGLGWLLDDLLGRELPAASLTPLPMSIGFGLLVLSGFALPPLIELGRTPPGRVLRRDLDPHRIPSLMLYGSAVSVIVAVLWYSIPDTRLLSYVLGGALGTSLLLAAGAWLLIRLLGRLRSRVGVAWRYGAANIARRGRESIVQVMAFGLGIMVLLLLGIVRSDLLESWRAQLPADAPNHFLINIQKDERADIAKFFRERSMPAPSMHAIVRARLSHVNDVPIENIEYDDPRARWFAEREANLSWAAELQPSNAITAGEWWTTEQHGEPLISIAYLRAERMGWKVGDTLTYNIGGEPISVTISSLRSVQWDSFEPNFFMLLPPGVLENYAATFITSLYLRPGESRQLLELVHRHPSITVIDLDAILNQVRDVMAQASLAVEYVFLFTLAAGMLVLLAAVQASRDERRFESAMLRTLGASRSMVRRGVVAEFLLLGFLSGLLAAGAATAASYLLATEVFDLVWRFNPVLLGLGLVLGALFVGVTGWLATRSVVNHPPLATLRQG